MHPVGSTIFADPESYKASLRGTKIELVFTGRGVFNARLTSVELPNLHLLCCQENLPRIAYISLPPRRVFISFATHFDSPPTSGGIELQPGDIIFHGVGESMHQRTDCASDWAFISVAPEYLARIGKVLTGADLIPPPAGRILRPPAIASTYLHRLVAKVCRVTKTQPDVIARSECMRSLEQDLFHTLVRCLTANDAHHYSSSRRHHAEIMARFEKVLAAQSDRQLLMEELCKAIGAPERTLRVCCAEILGMGPSEYIRLRRLNKVRAALRRVDTAEASIAKIARRYGFTEPGRFAVAYRSVFGETPSSTRRRYGGCEPAEFA